MSSSEIPDEDSEFDVALDEDVEIKEPPKYAVFLHNDDYTTMEFVVEVLVRYFNKSADEAANIMLQVHRQGRGVAGIYSRDIAETKAEQVTQLARSRGFPLMCTVEKV